MQQLPDGLLLEAYKKARELNLNCDFLLLMEEEINRRNIIIINS